MRSIPGNAGTHTGHMGAHGHTEHTHEPHITIQTQTHQQSNTEHTRTYRATTVCVVRGRLKSK